MVRSALGHREHADVEQRARRTAHDHRNIQSRLYLWLDMISRGTFRSSSPVTRTETPFRRSVMNRHDVHHAAKIATSRARTAERTAANSTTAGTNSVSVDVTDKQDVPSEEKIRNHCRGVIAEGARRPRGTL